MLFYKFILNLQYKDNNNKRDDHKGNVNLDEEKEHSAVIVTERFGPTPHILTKVKIVGFVKLGLLERVRACRARSLALHEIVQFLTVRAMWSQFW